MSDLQMELDRERALRIRCRYCHAGPGQGCRNRITGALIAGPAHLDRLIDTREGQ